MTVLVAGATGATGRLVVQQLLDRGVEVRAIVRAADRLPAALRGHAGLMVIEASLLDLSDAELAANVDGCDAVVSCLGHNLTLRGMYGRPRMLVTEATRRLCAAIRANEPGRPVGFVLMNTAGNRNRGAVEPISCAQKCVVAIIRALVPPHRDNERAAEHLRTEVGAGDAAVEWVAVRPDTLIDDPAVTSYDVHSSPVRSAIVTPGKTSRINVAHFRAEFVTDPVARSTWRGQMPVLYNRDAAAG